MGNILILYDSKTGNTAKMADYVAQGAKEVDSIEVRLLAVSEASEDDIFWCDGIAVGSPTYEGIVSWRMKRFWDEIVPKAWGKVDGKIACAFSSSGGWGGGAELTCLSLYIMLMNYGFLVFGVPDYVGETFTLHHGAIVAHAPKREEEIAACRRLGKRLAQWVAVYADGRKEYYPGPMKQRR